MCHNYIGSDTHAHVFPHDGWSFSIFFFFLFASSASPHVSHCMPFFLVCSVWTERKCAGICVQHARDGTTFQVPIVTCRFTGIVLSVHRCCYCWRFFFFLLLALFWVLIQTRHSATLSRCNRITLETMQEKYHNFRCAEEVNEKWKNGRKKKRKWAATSNWWTSARLALALLWNMHGARTHQPTPAHTHLRCV